MIAIDHPPTYAENTLEGTLPPSYDVHVLTPLLDGGLANQNSFNKHVSKVTHISVPCKPVKARRLPWQSKTRKAEQHKPSTSCRVSRVEVAQRCHNNHIQARVLAKNACQVEVVLPNDFCGAVVVHKAYDQPHLGHLLALDARKRSASSAMVASTEAIAVYDVQPRAVIMALTYRSMQVPFRGSSENDSQPDVCEVVANGAAVCVRYAAETGSADMRSWYANVLSSGFSSRFSH